MDGFINKIGKYNIDYRSILDENGHIDGKKLDKKQKEIALAIVRDNDNQDYRSEYLNFLMSVTAVRAKDLKNNLLISPSQISLWKSGANKITDPTWTLFRCAFNYVLIKGSITGFVPGLDDAA